MRTMKTFNSFLAAVVLLGLASLCHAVPVSNSNGARDYLINDASLNRWSFGIYGEEREWNVRTDPQNIPYSLDSRKIMAYVGLNLTRWLMVYGTIGESETELKNTLFAGDAGYEMAYGGGVHLNILDHEIPDPTLLENKLRVVAGFQYIFADTDQFMADWEWEEYLAYLTISLVNDIDGNKLFLPNSIAIYAGPAYTDIRSDDIEQTSDEFGYMAGLEVFYTESISLDIGVQSFHSTGLTAGMHIRF